MGVIKLHDVETVPHAPSFIATTEALIPSWDTTIQETNPTTVESTIGSTSTQLLQEQSATWDIKIDTSNLADTTASTTVSIVSSEFSTKLVADDEESTDITTIMKRSIKLEETSDPSVDKTSASVSSVQSVESTIPVLSMLSPAKFLTNSPANSEPTFSTTATTSTEKDTTQTLPPENTASERQSEGCLLKIIKLVVMIILKIRDPIFYIKMVNNINLYFKIST